MKLKVFRSDNSEEQSLQQQTRSTCTDYFQYSFFRYYILSKLSIEEVFLLKKRTKKKKIISFPLNGASGIDPIEFS